MINITCSIFLILNIEDYSFFVIGNICYFTYICLFQKQFFTLLFSKFIFYWVNFSEIWVKKISNSLVTLIATFHPSINLAPRYFISPVQTYRLVHRQLTNYPNLIIDLRLRLRAWKIFINKTFFILGPLELLDKEAIKFFLKS